jgi:hypothetical protein
MKLEEVNQRAKEAVDFLVAALESGHSEVLTAYLSAMAKFHTYSFGYILLIARRSPRPPTSPGFALGTRLDASSSAAKKASSFWLPWSARNAAKTKRAPPRRPIRKMASPDFTGSGVSMDSTDYLVICGRAFARSM